MATINSRDEDANSIPKVKQSRTYRPLEMTDDAVRELASMFYTASEIAALFKTTKTTVLNLHGDAYRQGKSELVQMPRAVRKQAMKDFMAWPEDTGNSWSHPDAPYNRMMQLAEVIENKYGPADEEVSESSLAGVSSEDLEVLLNSMGYVKKES